MGRSTKFVSFIAMGLLCLTGISQAATTQHQHKAKKQQKQELPPLPSGPTGPVPQLGLDSVPAVAPQVSYRQGQLTILAPNSSLGDILRAVRKQTGAEMEIPPNVNERVVTQLGPAPAREVLAELLNGSRFNYVLLGSPADASALTRVVLVAKTAGEAAGQNPQAQQEAANQPATISEPLQPDTPNAQPDSAEAEANDDNASDDNAAADQNATEAEQPAANPEQPGVKTPQQMLQEMQQRQLQLQQQQQQGQQPIPGVGYPPQGAPPQRQQQQ